MAASRVRANTRSGWGNFHMKPNGIFYVAGDKAGVLETGAYLKQQLRPDIATQSGPMLVINGRLHPRFVHANVSLKQRSGVGVRDPHGVRHLRDEVSFQAFGRLFLDRLECNDALFLDGGSVPALYAPSLNRGANLFSIGPMIGVFERATRPYGTMKAPSRAAHEPVSRDADRPGARPVCRSTLYRLDGARSQGQRNSIDDQPDRNFSAIVKALPTM